MTTIRIKPNIKVNISCICFLSSFDDKKIIYTVWEEDYDLVIKAIKESKRFKKEHIKFQKKHNIILEGK